MSAGDVGVLRQEAGKEGSRMPAWKRELLERRKAKGGGSGPGVDSVSSRVNGELTGSFKDEAAGANSSRTYTITPAGKRSGAAAAAAAASPDMSPVKTKEPWSAMDPNDRATPVPKTIKDHGVLQDSLGPIKENPFIKLEEERKKRRERESAARPLQHILEMYGSVPGIRTIRAENIIIIESDPEYFSASGTQHNGTVSGYSSLGDLLDRRGSPVTEIRAKEVVIYDSALSKSEENLSTLGRASNELSDLAQGTVSRMLQKFDGKYGKLHGKSRSSENLLDLDTSPILTGHRARFHHSDLVPKSAPCPQPASPVRSPAYSNQTVFHGSQSSDRTHPESSTGSQSTSPGPGSPKSVSSFRRRFEVVGGRSVTLSPREDTERSQSKPARERDWDSTDGVTKAKVPCSPESHCARAQSLVSPSLPLISPRFEIRPSPRPDLSTLPAGDLEAHALANLRLKSRNSFTVIPKRQGTPSAPGSTAPSSPILSPARPHVEPLVPSVPTPTLPTPASPSPEKTVVAPLPPVPDNTEPTHPERPSSPASSWDPSGPSPDSLTKSASPLPQEQALEKLPVTNIDDIVVEPSPPLPSPMAQRRKGNTFTVVPKRRTEPEPGTPVVQEPPQEPTPVPQSSPSTTEAPYAHLGALLKKRYPAVEDIEVIGGYLSLGRSCLSKTGSTGKKLKISFNESSLQSTYEYPSENSVWDSGDEEEEDGGKGGGEEEGGISGDRIHIPRPSFISSPTDSSPSSTDLSSYTPKHSVDFTAWQEKKLPDETDQGEANPQSADMSGQVMLTPADSSFLSDFSSEPALYF